jgi:1-phosphatidylinositol-3-phosphate 5-kinase
MSTCWLQYVEAVKVLFYDLVQKFSLWIPRKRAETHAMSRDFWMPDQSCRVCYECDTPFSLFNRRHHCRICGRVFCWKCTQHTLPIVPDGVEEWQGSERVRACNFCFKLKQAEQRQIAEDKIVAKPSSPPTTPSSSNFSLSSSSANTSRNSISSSSSSSSASGNVRQIPLPYGFRTSMTEKIEPIAERQRPRRRHGRRSRRTESPRGRDLSPNPYDFMGNR